MWGLNELPGRKCWRFRACRRFLAHQSMADSLCTVWSHPVWEIKGHSRFLRIKIWVSTFTEHKIIKVMGVNIHQAQIFQSYGCRHSPSTKLSKLWVSTFTEHKIIKVMGVNIHRAQNYQGYGCQHSPSTNLSKLRVSTFTEHKLIKVMAVNIHRAQNYQSFYSSLGNKLI